MSGYHFHHADQLILFISTTAMTLGQGHGKVIQHISLHQDFLCPKHLSSALMVFDMVAKFINCGGGGQSRNELKTQGLKKVPLFEFIFEWSDFLFKCELEWTMVDDIAMLVILISRHILQILRPWAKIDVSRNDLISGKLSQ